MTPPTLYTRIYEVSPEEDALSYDRGASPNDTNETHKARSRLAHGTLEDAGGT